MVRARHWHKITTQKFAGIKKLCLQRSEKCKGIINHIIITRFLNIPVKWTTYKNLSANLDSFKLKEEALTLYVSVK